MRYLVFDVSNLLHKTFYAHNTEDDITLAGLASHSALATINKYQRTFKGDKIIMAFDRFSWRKKYTASEECLSQLPYKGGRRLNQTEKQKARYELFKQHINEFEQLVTDHTSMIAMAQEPLEADDIIAGCVHMLTMDQPDNEVVIISADKDFMQLLRYDNVYLVDPATGKERTLSDYNNDADYFMFEKCIRGEGANGDNVQSSYPRVRSTKILEAYNDEFARTNMMNHEWTHPTSNRTFRVGDLFKEAELLMDLEKQPDDIMELIIETVLTSLDNPGKFNYFEFLKYCGKHELKKISEGVDNYVKTLSL